MIDKIKNISAEMLMLNIRKSIYIVILTYVCQSLALTCRKKIYGRIESETHRFEASVKIKPLSEKKSTKYLSEVVRSHSKDV